MPGQNTTLSNRMQTLLLVVGIVIALLLSFKTYVINPSTPVVPTAVEQPKQELKKEEAGGGGEESSVSPTLHSSTRLFQYFTENLPYLNNK